MINVSELARTRSKRQVIFPVLHIQSFIIFTSFLEGHELTGVQLEQDLFGNVRLLPCRHVRSLVAALLAVWRSRQ